MLAIFNHNNEIIALNFVVVKPCSLNLALAFRHVSHLYTFLQAIAPTSNIAFSSLRG